MTFSGISGNGPDSYSDIGREEIAIRTEELGPYREGMTVGIKSHSVNIIQIGL